MESILSIIEIVLSIYSLVLKKSSIVTSGKNQLLFLGTNKAYFDDFTKTSITINISKNYLKKFEVTLRTNKYHLGWADLRIGYIIDLSAKRQMQLVRVRSIFGKYIAVFKIFDGLNLESMYPYYYKHPKYNISITPGSEDEEKFGTKDPSLG